MQCDYYAFRQAELRSSLNVLEQAAEEAKRFSEIANGIRDAWQKHLAVVDAQPAPQAHFDFRKLPDTFRFVPKPDIATVANLPRLSFLLHIAFRLQKPYLSKDERDFYLIDNPLRREKVFQMPMVASTSWKGALRAALWQLDYKEKHEITIRLFGNPRASDEHQAGRLHFFPTFFEQVGLEVINPHDRKTGVGTPRGPILMECVQQGSRGELVLLYVPFGPIGQNGDERRAQVAQDLEVVAKGIQAMLTTYGFGAKTSSGFGTAEDRLAGEGKLALRAELACKVVPSAAPPGPQEPALPRYLESPTRLRAELRREDGILKSEKEYRAFIEGQGKKYTKKNKQLYDKAKGWWEREGRAMAEAASEEPGPEPEPAPSQAPPVSELTFRNLSELCEVAQQVAAHLLERGEA